MSVETLVTELESLGVRLWEEDGKLRFRAPAGVLTPQRRESLSGHRDAILDLVRAPRVPLAVAHPQQRYEPFPLTDIQGAYLLGRRETFAYGGVACHGYGELRFTELSVDRLQAAWNALIVRHDMLRATVDPSGFQQVRAEVPKYRIDVNDLGDADEAQFAAAVAATRAELDHRVYRPDEWPLFALRVTASTGGCVLHFSIDFLICDFVSIQVLLDELQRRYVRLDEEPEPLAITYRDYLLAERPMHSGDRYERDKAWWLDRLDTLPPAPELPLLPGAGSRTAGGPPPRFRRLEATLSRSEWSALRERAGRHGITPSGAVLAAFAETIGRWSRLPRFTLNITLLNRPPLHPQVDRIVGDFTSVSMLAVEQRLDEPLHERAKDLQATLWTDLDHRLFSGVEVLREITRRPGADEALMPVVFTSAIGLGHDNGTGENNGTGDNNGKDGGGDAGHAGFADLGYGISQTPQVWIDCQNIERRGGLATNWDVREGVFPAGMVDDAFAAYADLLRRLAGGDEVWQQAAPIPVPPPHARRRAAVNATSAPLHNGLQHEGLLHDGLLAQACRTPDAPVLITPTTTLTYAELVARAAAVADALIARGCVPGDLVAIIAAKDWPQIVAVLGTLLAGAVYVPVDVNQPPARRDLILISAGVRLVLTEAALAEPAGGGSGEHESGEHETGWPAGMHVLAVDRLVGPQTPSTTASTNTAPTNTAPTNAAPTNTEPARRRAEPDDLAYVIHTSGSTGTPKGVMITHRAALNTVSDINRRFEVGAGDRVLGLAGLGFDLSVYDIFGPPAVGACLVLPAADRRTDPTHWADLIATHGVTLWNSVPAQLQMLSDYLQAVGWLALPSLRLAMLSGDWIPVPLPDEVRRRIPGLRVISMGGATEAAIWSIWYPIEDVDPAWRSIPYGVPLANQSFHVLDSALRPVPDWVVGELYIGGTGLATGYLKDPVKTAERFIIWPATGERLYRTGDLGRYLPDATIEFLGREDFQVKIRGHRIELAEVETAMLSHPGVSSAAVVVEGDRPLERRLVAFAETARIGESPVPPELGAVAAQGGRAVLDGVDLESYLDYLRQLDDAALDAVVDALRGAGLFTDPSDRHTTSGIEAALGVAPRHRRLLRRLVEALVAEGRLARDPQGSHRSLRPPMPPELAWQRVSELAVAGGDSAQILDYFRTSAASLPALLRDEQDPLQLLFPDGRVDLSNSLYAEALFNRWANRAVAAAVAWLATHRPRSGPARVLEVGAGAGGTTAEVLAALEGVAVDYLSTDVSPFFLAESATRFAGRADLRYATFDLDRDYRAQGLSPNAYDLIIAGDVLHATRDVAATLARLRELLVPGGFLVFVEMTRDHYQIMTSLELLVRLDSEQGDFVDLRQGTDQMFLRAEQWHALLVDAGARVAACVPGEDDAFGEVGIRVFAARFKADRVPVDAGDLHAHLTRLLPEHMLPATIQVVDRLPHTDNGKLDRATLTRWIGTTAAVPPAGGEAPRTDLEERVAAVWATVLSVQSVARDDSFFDLGGDSLQAAKLAGELIEGVPEAAGVFFDELLRQILEHPCVAELADFLATVCAVAPHEPAPESGNPTAAGRDLPVRPLGGAGLGRYVLVAGDDGAHLADALGRLGEVFGVRAGAGAGVDRLAADAAGALRRDVGAAALHVVGAGDGAVLALELARQLVEGGHEPAGLTLIEPRRPAEGAGPLAPYVADVTLILDAGTSDEIVRAWAQACLGELTIRRVDAADAASVVACLCDAGRA